MRAKEGEDGVGVCRRASEGSSDPHLSEAVYSWAQEVGEEGAPSKE